MGFDDGWPRLGDKYNFEMLNIPKDHPARHAGHVLRRTISCCASHFAGANTDAGKAAHPHDLPGRMHRSDDVDATHSPIFNQIEGLW